MLRRLHAWLPFCLTVVLGFCFLASADLQVRAADAAGKWYKGNTHAHTYWSDGDDFPEMVAQWYKTHGYDFLAMSDHNRLMEGEQWSPIDHGKRPVSSAALKKCQECFGSDWPELRDASDGRQVKLKTLDEVRRKVAEPEKFLLIQNEEITSHSPDRQVHINAINLSDRIAPQFGRDVVDTISLNLVAVAAQSRRLDRPILAHVNHLTWPYYDISAEDLAGASAARFFEVYNGHADVWNSGNDAQPGAEKMWDVANTIRIAKMKTAPLFGVAGDDAHNYHKFAPQRANPGRAWIMVHAPRLDVEAIIDAINRGDFYASTGVTLRNVDYDAAKRTVSVEVLPEEGVHYTIEFIGMLAGADVTFQTMDDPSAEGRKYKRSGRKYSPEVGKVLSSAQGTSASYTFNGRELYVRAVVRSDKPMSRPAIRPQRQAAWCQPMGWVK